MKRTISTTISDRYYVEAKKRGIRWSEALRLGIIKLAQMEDGTDLKEVNVRINEQEKTIQKLKTTIGFLNGLRLKTEAKEKKK